MKCKVLNLCQVFHNTVDVLLWMPMHFGRNLSSFLQFVKCFVFEKSVDCEVYVR
jgi:hypothetical protein